MNEVALIGPANDHNMMSMALALASSGGTHPLWMIDDQAAEFEYLPAHREWLGMPYRLAWGRRAQKCILPGCNIMTDQRGGYCCAEHSNKHRRRSI